jgi:hypothetical protein
MSNLNKKKVAVVFISGSAGELDWILPILDYLLQKKFKIKIIFLSRHAFKSVEENNMCNEFINSKNINIETISLGGYFFEKIERIGYLTYRGFLKLELSKIPFINSLFKLYFSFLKFLFITKLPTEITDFKDNKYLFFSEFPGLRRPRDKWIKEMFNNSVFFYSPHSPHIYVEDLDRQYEESFKKDFRKNAFLLLGHPGDFEIINDGKELASKSLEKLFIGHPKYSNNWLRNLKKESRLFRETHETRNKTTILVLSRGYGSYLDESSHIQMVDKTIETIEEQFPNYSLLVKKHPREIPSHWDTVSKKNKAIEVVNEHILQLATKADFVISFWGSGSMDCFLLGVPVIEYWDPVKHHKQQVPINDTYTTIYRKLGIVLQANDALELGEQISRLKSFQYILPEKKVHPYFDQLITRSNQWNETIEKILLSKDFILD